MTAEGSFPNPTPNPRLASSPSKKRAEPSSPPLSQGEHPANPRLLHREGKAAWKPLWKGAKAQSQGVGENGRVTSELPPSHTQLLLWVLDQLKENTPGQPK